VNAALVLDVARAFAGLSLAPRRTVRFVLFTGEEQGLWGSLGYARRHAAEMDRHVAAIVFDTGSGRIQGFYLNGREDLRKIVDRALAGVPGAARLVHPPDGIDGTDNFDFLLAGVPNLVAAQDPIPYLADYHAESDVFERVDGPRAKENAGIAAALVWGLADGAAARPYSRAEVEKLLVETHLVEQMKGFGQWDGWVSGSRGEHVRAPGP
jgi:Zn-dependent M28 family amino/carboxypeptidase